jgi:acetate kinase
MRKLVMAVNAGSSSIKFKLYEIKNERVILSGIVDRIGHNDAIFKMNFNGEERKAILPVKNHEIGVDLILEKLVEFKIVESIEEIQGVGHRIVQGGKYFQDSAVLNKDTEDKIEALIPLAPLHNAFEVSSI